MALDGSRPDDQNCGAFSWISVGPCIGAPYWFAVPEAMDMHVMTHCCCFSWCVLLDAITAELFLSHGTSDKPLGALVTGFVRELISPAVAQYGPGLSLAESLKLTNGHWQHGSIWKPSQSAPHTAPESSITNGRMHWLGRSSRTACHDLCKKPPWRQQPRAWDPWGVGGWFGIRPSLAYSRLTMSDINRYQIASILERNPDASGRAKTWEPIKDYLQARCTTGRWRLHFYTLPSCIKLHSVTAEEVELLQQSAVLAEALRCLRGVAISESGKWWSSWPSTCGYYLACFWRVSILASGRRWH